MKYYNILNYREQNGRLYYPVYLGLKKYIILLVGYLKSP